MQKKGSNKKVLSENRSITTKDDMEEYAKVIKNLGDRRLSVVLPDSSEAMALIPGRFRKRCWIIIGDIVLVSRRSFENGKLDIIHKYNINEVRKLNKDGEIPDFFLDGESKEDLDTFEFDEEDNEEVNIKTI